MPMTSGVGPWLGERWAMAPPELDHPPHPIRLLATASAPPSGYRAPSDLAKAAVAFPFGCTTASLQVMVHSGPTSDAPLRSISRPRATERSGAPLPAAADARAGKYPGVKSGAER